MENDIILEKNAWHFNIPGNLFIYLIVHKTTYNTCKGEEGLIKTIDTPPSIKMLTLKASLKMQN